MPIDTSAPNSDCVAKPVAPPHVFGQTSSAEGEILPAAIKTTPRQKFEALLSHFDGQFAPLMNKFRIKSTSAPFTQNAVAKASAPLSPPMPPSGPSDDDLRERDAFLARLTERPPVVTVFQPASSQDDPTKRSLRQGLGPPVLVGFDCEWVYACKGKNRILSVQFCLIGPTGERLTKVIEVAGDNAVEVRPSLAEALDELLDEAEVCCVFDEWPCEVILCGFFTRADITVFRDFKDFRGQLQGINGTLATVGKPAKLKLPLDDARADRLKSRYAFVVGDDFDPRLLMVRVIDSSRLAPPGVSLLKLGEWLDIPKMQLPPGYSKSDMGRLQRERPEFFKAYGLRDAEIAVLYVIWVIWFCDRHLGLKGLSATASGLGVRLAQLCMRRDGVHPDIALNFMKVQRWRWGTRDKRPVSKKTREPTQVRRWFETFLADVYIGGRNECYWFGPTPVTHAAARLSDHDLAGCYVVSLGGVMVMDYDRIEIVREKERFTGHVAGYAQVRFRFPPETHYPCLPVTVGNFGLWFPLSGVSLATAPEIELAMMMGAEVEILFGLIIPWMARGEVFARSAKTLRQSKKVKKTEAKVTELEFDDDVFVPVQEMQFPPESHGDGGYRLFESFAIYTRTMRLKYRRKTLPNEFVKLVGNACYGKTGQGFKEKRTFGPQEMGSVKIGPSAISEAAVAALVSGFARAVLGEMLWKLPAGSLAVSATTDGLLVDVETLDLSGTMCRRFQTLVDRVAPGTGMTELKHLIVQAVAGKTRLQMTGKTVEGHDPVVAKGGVKVLLDSAGGDEAKEKKLLTPAGQNSYVLDLFVNRYPGQKIKRPSLMSMREQLLNEFDLQSIDREVALNMEFDFKRQPVDARMIHIESCSVEHLAFATVPWQSAEEGELVRTLFDKWRKGDKDTPGHCLKNMDDWAGWQAFQGLYVGNRQRMQRFKALQEAAEDAGTALLPSPDASPRRVATRSTSGMFYATGKTSFLGVAIRMFLTAYVQRAWGLVDADLSQSKLAQWLTDAGYPTRSYDVKNAGRSELHEHVVVGSPEIMTFLDTVKARFAGLDVGMFLVAE